MCGCVSDLIPFVHLQHHRTENLRVVQPLHHLLCHLVSRRYPEQTKNINCHSDFTYRATSDWTIWATEGWITYSCARLSRGTIVSWEANRTLQMDHKKSQISARSCERNSKMVLPVKQHQCSRTWLPLGPSSPGGPRRPAGPAAPGGPVSPFSPVSPFLPCRGEMSIKNAWKT